MNNLFDINLEELTVQVFQNSKIYTIDNFYKYPNDVLNFIDSQRLTLWKSWETPSYNGTHFIDCRHDFTDFRLSKIDQILEGLCDQQISQPCRIVTNKIKFINYNFNDYFNNYWAPHRDLGYTGIVYFNSSGTNLYEQIADDKWNDPEHAAPWRLKSKYRLIKTLNAKFNRMILFDGAKFLHGMDIQNDEYFKNYRFNQAFFLTPKPHL
jgi:hypothetical protein